MPRKSKNTKNVEPSIFRVMIERLPFNQSHIDFNSKEEALQYVHNLNDPIVAWYGVYEISPLSDYLIDIENKRLIPHDDRIIIKPKESNINDEKGKRKRSPRKVKQK